MLVSGFSKVYEQILLYKVLYNLVKFVVCCLFNQFQKLWLNLDDYFAIVRDM